ncbi:polyisoprenoid-binding protein YceI [Flavobacterium sp. CG_9.10]|uniref:YceI family protein n=1 Tax=Flavobacterium sp. CG_9.10 TaxID=2787729 RepID=UPI0018C8D7C4|nr:YceI family protein [Flavobacterium sp. CG_9.10]MBG6111034.1 polyisoprenoid-binding protein YceI [Flavobacterium sp. CG_9.10]
MKSIKKIIIVLIVTLSFLQTEAQTYKIDVSKSKITWIGKKVTGQHEGIVKFKDGNLIFKNKKLVGGNFNADMKSLTNTDQSGTSKMKLEGHLKSNDFFAVDDYPIANLIFKHIRNQGDNVYSISADLTIKGKTNPVKFDLVVKKNSAKADFTLDRTKFDIKYGSGSFFDDLGDKTIYDDFDMNVNLVF